jgi:hypothetical protein
MRRVVRENATCALLAVAGSAVMAWLGLSEMAWGGDYEHEARPAFEAIAHGHLLSFLRLAPAYGGSLIERAPFALLPGLWGGGEESVYRMVALPCLIAGAGLGLWLVAQARAQNRSAIAIGAVLALCVVNPLTVRALELGHPEELLGAVLCVSGVLLAQRGRAVPAGIVLGLAIANKEWALLAIGPVLLALPSRRVAMLLCAGAAAALVLAPLALVGGGGFVSGAGASAAPSATIFQPMQIFWFLGELGGSGRLLEAIGTISHPLVIAVAVPLTALAWRTRRRAGDGSSPEERPGGAGGSRRPADALLLLSLLLLLRCMLDTWDNVYYPLPFVIALLVWETCSLRRAPLLALSSTVIVWINGWLSLHSAADFQAAFFLAWSVPLAVSLGTMLYLSGRAVPWRWPRQRGARARNRALALPRAAR